MLQLQYYNVSITMFQCSNVTISIQFQLIITVLQLVFTIVTRLQGILLIAKNAVYDVCEKV